jgi:hypothetical protein
VNHDVRFADRFEEFSRIGSRIEEVGLNAVHRLSSKHYIVWLD